jgi:hypothetical protein
MAGSWMRYHVFSHATQYFLRHNEYNVAVRVQPPHALTHTHKKVSKVYRMPEL